MMDIFLWEMLSHWFVDVIVGTYDLKLQPSVDPRDHLTRGRAASGSCFQDVLLYKNQQCVHIQSAPEPWLQAAEDPQTNMNPTRTTRIVKSLSVL